jgi:hypothetical protein
MMTDIDDRRRDLSNYAMSSGQLQQPVPSGHTLVRPTAGLADRVIGAQPVAVYRDEAKILQKLAALAAAAGTDWFYRYPVKSKDGGQSWIEGPSIKLANDVARIFGNNVNEIREIDVGDAWVFYARFTDIETGFSMERAYRQRKSQGSIKTKDAERQLDISYQIGQSKSIRNCIVNALQIYADHAFELARNSLVDKIGRDLDAYRKRVIEGLAKVPVALNRVERTIGRASKDWLAPDVARVIAMMKSIADGMATVEEVFPAIEATQPPAAPARPPAATPAGHVQPPSDEAGASTAIEHDGDDSQVKPEPSVGDLIGMAQKRPPKDPEVFRMLTRQIIEAAKLAGGKASADFVAWWSGPNARSLRNAAQMSADDTAELSAEIKAAFDEIESGPAR